MAAKGALKVVGEVTNGAEELVAQGEPYVATVTLQGVSDLLFHRWNVEGVKEQSTKAKGSKGRKTDVIENYVWRNEAGQISIPGEYLRMAIVGAAKFRQDPRSPRKSAMDLYKAGIVALTTFASLGKDKWDYEDTRRCVIQRSGINRTRPAMRAGWKATFEILVLLPEYIQQDDLYDVIKKAGELVGLADFRPTYGRYNIAKFEVRQS